LLYFILWIIFCTLWIIFCLIVNRKSVVAPYFSARLFCSINTHYNHNFLYCQVLSCSAESDRQRWLEAVNPPVSNNPDETVYEEWDCPQVMAIHHYVASQPDELSLEAGDVVNVLRKMIDGKI